MASPAPPSSPDGNAPVPAAPAVESQADLPDHLVEDILLRLPTADDLGRASTATISFRRIIAGHSFLRRFRALHPPPLLGVLAYESTQRANLSVAFLPAQPPHPSSTAAACTLCKADFSCSFLPSPELWSYCDFRDGRLLLSKKGAFLANLAVCDPLHRRYLLLAALPDDLAALSRQLDVTDCDPFLAPAGDNEGNNVDAPSGFRVMCLRGWCSSKQVLFIFYLSGAGAGQWHTVTFHGWGALMPGHVGWDFLSYTPYTLQHYAHACFYWQIPYRHELLVFDTRTKAFSCLSVPRSRDQMEAREGRLGMFCRGVEDFENRSWYDIMQVDRNHLLYDILRDNGDGTKQWQREYIIPEPHNYRYSIIGVAGGHLLLHGNLRDPESRDIDYNYYSIDLQTLKLEWFCGSAPVFISSDTRLYTGFLPSLSPPTI